MAFNPLAFIGTGVSDSSQVNNIIDAVNKLLVGLGQTGVGTCNSALTLGTSLADVPGCSVTINVAGSNAFVVVTASVQFVVTGAAGITMLAQLLVDGVNQSALGSVRDSADNIHDADRSYTWFFPIAAGSHTLKLQGVKSAALGTCAISNTAGTNLVVQLYDIP